MTRNPSRSHSRDHGINQQAGREKDGRETDVKKQLANHGDEAEEEQGGGPDDD